MRPVRVLLADDHALVRSGLRLLFESLPGVQVVAEAQDGREALRLIREHRPDIAFFDVAMPDFNGLEAARQVASEFPDVRVVMLSMHGGEEYVLQAFRAGVAGYLLKSARAEELETAIESVARGETYLSPAVSKHLVADFIRGESRDLPPLDRLTPRQRETLKLVAAGHTSKEIAQIQGVSIKTVETHRAQLMERLNIHDVAGLVRFAVSVGLVSADD